MKRRSWFLFILLSVLTLSACSESNPPLSSTDTPVSVVSTNTPVEQVPTEMPVEQQVPTEMPVEQQVPTEIPVEQQVPTQTPVELSPTETPVLPTPVAPPTQTPVAPPTDRSSTPTFNLLVMATGEVKLKREKWSDYHATAFGAILQRGDQVWPSEGAQVAILCDNFTLWHVPTGSPSGLNGCPQSKEPLLIRDGSLIINTRGNDPFIPYIISPRATKLLNGMPTLRWNGLGSNRLYTVYLDGTDWQIETSETEVVYSGSPLEAGVTYSLVVEADNGRSSDEDRMPGLGFERLTEEEALPVRQAADQLAGLALSHEAEVLALAHLYVAHGLFTEASELLESLVMDGNQSAAISRTLAHFYQRVGLPLLAWERYPDAIQLAQAAGDVEGVSAAQAGLAEALAALGTLQDKADAIDFFKQAQAGVESLGDIEQALALLRRRCEFAERLGQQYEREGNIDEAIRWLSEARDGYQTLGEPQRVSELTEHIEALR